MRYVLAALFAICCSASVIADDVPPKRVALLVGVNHYMKPGFKDLQFAEADVQAVGAELKKLGFEVTILLGSGQGEKQATLANIESAARAMVRPLTKNDVALVMLSGHGQQLLADPNDVDLNKSQSYYCPVDALVNRPETQFSLTHLTDDILAPNVGTKLLLVDACRDVPADQTRGGRNSKGIEGRVISLPEDTGVFFSCRAGQMSFERHELRHGLFTYCLLDGLRGAAAREGELAWADLVAHVNRRMVQDDISKLMPTQLKQVPIPAGAVPHTILGKVTARPAATIPHTTNTPAAALPPAGSLDASFGERGRAFINFGFGGLEDAYQVTLQADGKLVVAGAVEKASQAGNYYFGIARLNADGSADTTFNGTGKTTVNFGPYNDLINGRGLAIQSDGKIVCGGFAEATGWGYEFGIVRLLPNGTPDPTFGMNGRVHTELTRRGNQEVLSSYLHAIAIQPDGRIVAAGNTALRGKGEAQPGFAVVRYLADGRVDSSFGSGGLVVTDLYGGLEEVLALVIQPDGKIVLVGTTAGREGKDGVVLRYTRNGVLDSTFDGDGMVTLNFDRGSHNNAYDVAIQGDKLLVLVNGDRLDGSAVLRLLPNGQLDTTFGVKRTGIAAVGTSSIGLAVLPDGRILTADQNRYAVVTLTANGLVESTAASGTGGVSARSSDAASPQQRQEVARYMLRANDGSLFFAGPTKAGGRSLMTVVKTHGPD